jgi:predicted amidohydrolase YtcJ
LGGPAAEAIVTVGERIVASGTAAELAERFSSGEHVDFGDGVVVPGFIGLRRTR